MDVYQLNNSGFNIFHLVISTSNFEFTKIILDNFPDFIHKKTKFNQTNLMIALNQKNFDIIKLILEHENLPLDLTDDSGFDIFMYLIRNNSIVLFFHFLKKHLEMSSKSKKIEENIHLQSSHSINSFCDEKDELNWQNTVNSKFGDRFLESIFSLKNKDKQGCNLLHWAAFRDGEFLLKFFMRLGCDFNKKDFKGNIPIEKATENNSVRVVHFLDSYTKYPFQTNYFLFNKFKPIEFDFFPNSYSKIENEYESEILKGNFNFKKLNLGTYSVKNLLYFYSKFNLKYHFGLILYFVWIFVTCLTFFVQMNFPFWVLKFLFFSVACFNLILNFWFYTFVKK